MAGVEKKRYVNGLVLGKFMPPHIGHEYLIENALSSCEKLTILVYSLPSHPIDGDTRASWMRELFPDARVLHVRDFIPIYAESDPRYWRMWAAQVKQNHPEHIDAIFSSEDYGYRLSEELGAEHVCVDKQRATFRISASEIRNDPLGHIYLVSSVARPYFRNKPKAKLI